jgi:hypothetical protein
MTRPRRRERGDFSARPNPAMGRDLPKKGFYGNLIKIFKKPFIVNE